MENENMIVSGGKHSSHCTAFKNKCGFIHFVSCYYC